MKVLILAAYFYKQGIKGAEKNKTGYGLLIPDIAMSVGATNTVLLQVYRNTSYSVMKSDYGSCHVLDKPLLSISSFNYNGLKNGIKSIFNLQNGIVEKIHEFYYWLNYGNVIETIKREKPDMVHIHGICEPFIAACEDINTPYIVTLHGLNGFLPHVSNNVKKHEKSFIEDAFNNNKIFTVISTGIKKRIEKEYLSGKTASNIIVIPNGTDIDRVRKSNAIDNRRNIITAIGTICERKNQMQLVEAINYLAERFDGWELHICGVDGLAGKLQEYVSNHSLSDKVIFRGFLEPYEIDELLNSAKLNIMASKDEGFGLSMIEAFAHGVPTVTFSDLDAVEDIYDENSMLLCSTRKKEDLAEVMYSAMNREWDHNNILAHARDFSLQKMALGYIAAYKKVLSESGK